MKKIIILLILFLGSITNTNAEVKRIISGNENAKITIIAYESLHVAIVQIFIKMFILNLKKIILIRD